VHDVKVIKMDSGTF